MWFEVFSSRWGKENTHTGAQTHTHTERERERQADKERNKQTNKRIQTQTLTLTHTPHGHNHTHTQDLMLQLNHPNVVRSFLLPVGDEDRPAIVMELLPLGNLKSFVREKYVRDINLLPFLVFFSDHTTWGISRAFYEKVCP